MWRMTSLALNSPAPPVLRFCFLLLLLTRLVESVCSAPAASVLCSFHCTDPDSRTLCRSAVNVAGWRMNPNAVVLDGMVMQKHWLPSAWSQAKPPPSSWTSRLGRSRGETCGMWTEWRAKLSSFMSTVTRRLDSEPSTCACCFSFKQFVQNQINWNGDLASLGFFEALV